MCNIIEIFCRQEIYLKILKAVIHETKLSTSTKFKVIDDSEYISYVILNFVTLVIPIMNKLRIFISNMLLVFKYAGEHDCIPSHVLNCNCKFG